jgi:hypothetical protein
MKVWIWILLLVNAIFFAVMQWGNGLLGADHSNQTLPELQAEKILIINPPVLAHNAGASKPDDIPAVSSVAPGNAPATPQALAKPESGICMEWGEFSGAELSRATAALQNLKLGDKMSQRQVEHNIGYWVYLPPLKDKAAIIQKLAQLKTRGVEEFFVVQDDPKWMNAISLGVFKTRDAAQKFLDALKAKDVHTAQIGDRSSKQKATVFIFRNLDAPSAAKVNTLRNGFSVSELKSMSCD